MGLPAHISSVNTVEADFAHDSLKGFNGKWACVQPFKAFKSMTPLVGYHKVLEDDVVLKKERHKHHCAKYFYLNRNKINAVDLVQCIIHEHNYFSTRYIA